jgi:hypothetical protein
VSCLVDFALQDLFSALHCERGNFAAQRFAGLHDLLFRVGLRLRDDASGFSLCLSLDFVGDCHCALFCLSNTLLTVVACLSQFLVDALVGGFEFSLALFSGRQTSAIFFERSSRALINGGHTNFIVNHARIRNTTICANRVALRFTVFP